MSSTASAYISGGMSWCFWCRTRTKLKYIKKSRDAKKIVDLLQALMRRKKSQGSQGWGIGARAGRGESGVHPQKEAALCYEKRSNHLKHWHKQAYHTTSNIGTSKHTTRTLMSGLVMSLRRASCSLLLYGGKREAVADNPALFVLAEEGGPADGGSGDICPACLNSWGKKTSQVMRENLKKKKQVLMCTVFWLLVFFCAFWVGNWEGAAHRRPFFPPNLPTPFHFQPLPCPTHTDFFFLVACK